MYNTVRRGIELKFTSWKRGVNGTQWEDEKAFSLYLSAIITLPGYHLYVDPEGVDQWLRIFREEFPM